MNPTPLTPQEVFVIEYDKFGVRTSPLGYSEVAKPDSSFGIGIAKTDYGNNPVVPESISRGQIINPITVATILRLLTPISTAQSNYDQGNRLEIAPNILNSGKPQIVWFNSSNVTDAAIFVDSNGNFEIQNNTGHTQHLGDFLPTTDNTYNLGSASFRWKGTNIIGLGKGLFGDGSDGDVTLGAGQTTLSRDMYYNSLTVPNGAVLRTNGYQIFVKGTLTINSGGGINWGVTNGANGSSATNNVGANGGAGGAATTGNTVPGGIAGNTAGAGGNGRFAGAGGVGGGGGDGGTGTNTNPSIGTSSVIGPAGKNGGQAGAFSGGSGGGTGTAGTATPALNLPDTIIGCSIHADLFPTYTAHQSSAGTPGAAGGGGGACDGPTPNFGGGGGGGGGSGGSSGVIVVFARTIVNNATSGIDVGGGAGGNGGNGAAGSSSAVQAGGGAGGNGGNGGTGGVIVIVYETLTQNGSFTANGGPAGTGGSGGSGSQGGAVGQNGVSGNTGATGKIWQFQIA